MSEWVEFRLEIPRSLTDAVSQLLVDKGAGGVSIEDSLDLKRYVAGNSNISFDYIEESLFKEDNGMVTVVAYYPSSIADDIFIFELKNNLKETAVCFNISPDSIHLSSKIVKDEDWADSWKAYYKPFEIIPGIFIKPSWEDETSMRELKNFNNNSRIIKLDPGMAFGTGTHETTRLCAHLIAQVLSPQNEVSVLDIGCGSGILSIISAILGASRITALDTDPVACEITKENCTLNNTHKITSVYNLTLQEMIKAGLPFKGYKASIIAANIAADVIIRLSPYLCGVLKEDGYLVLSGIIQSRKAEILTAYINNGILPISIIEEGEWVAILATAKTRAE